MSAARAQGIDLVAGGRNKSKHRSAPKSENVYQLLLVKVRARWTGCAWGRGGALAPIFSGARGKR